MSEPRHVQRDIGWQDRGRSSGILWYFCIVPIILALDQITKALVVSRMELYESIAVIPDFFHLTYILNTGASFGILQDHFMLFVIVTCLVVVFILWAVLFWSGAGKLIRIVLGLITGGAIGNLIDRIRFGAVVDFFDFRGIWSYIFNVADMAVVCGGFLLIIAILAEESKTSESKPKH